MLKKQITMQDAVDLLNEALKLDSVAVNSVCNVRCLCNLDLAKHETIQVGQAGRNGQVFIVGIIGLLNGMFGKDQAGLGALCAIYDDNFKITSFKIFDPKTDAYIDDVLNAEAKDGQNE